MQGSRRDRASRAVSTLRRSRDPGSPIQAWRETIWVVCPRCDGPARVATVETRHRLTCRRCAHCAERPIEGQAEAVGDATDGRFGLPLYLTAEIRGRRLWVYNLRHLDALAGWIGATLRERAPGGMHRNTTMMARLPRWMTSAAGRPRVVKTLAGLRRRALREGLS